MPDGSFTLSEFPLAIADMAKCERGSLSALAEWRQVNQGRDETQQCLLLRPIRAV